MRKNLPVSGKAHPVPDDVTLVSTTDTKGRITYANKAFVDVSGFSREELTRQPHNIVRHPDMPAEAFADMWATLGQGQPWSALVKNRRNNGDHYWVRANAMPVVRAGQPAGYISVRTRAQPEEIDAAERVYADFREGRAGSRAFHSGLIVRTGWKRWTTLLKTLPVRWRIRGALAALVPAMAAGAWIAGLGGLPLAAFAGLAAGAAVAACAWLEAQVSRPLERVLAQALAVASGESRDAVYMDRADEIGLTLRTISQLGLMFRWVVEDVSEQIVGVQSASQEIAQGTVDLSARTEQAAASVQETASSMEQMTATVKANADTVGQADQLAGSATQAAERGGEVVAHAVKTMQDITESSRRISDITGVIDSIAFQTNILALNAAVEAARAGEHGRGFAVVAAEVRGLAQRSASAAREIKSLIGTSVDKVESGTKHVDEAGRTMDDIVAQVKRVSGLIAGIGTATREQSLGISQVGQAVSHLDQITQQNAALVEQSSAASLSLKEQAQRLVDAIGVFR